METQIYSYIETSHKTQVVTIFGYATRGVPGIEVLGCGSISKNIKEKLIYLTRTRKLQLPTKRFVLCVDINDIDTKLNAQQMKWLEFPLLLLFWQLAGLLPIKKLDDCLCAGWIKTNGEIYHKKTPNNLKDALRIKLNPVALKSLKLISIIEEDDLLWSLDSSLLLEHIKELSFKKDNKDYMDKFSATPLNSSMA